jgi:hypothetical protein
MRLSSATTLVRLMVGCGVVAGHQHGHHGGADGGKHVPLHEREYIQDPVEELERKWSFEVRCVFSAYFLCDFFFGNCGLGDFLESRECLLSFLQIAFLEGFLLRRLLFNIPCAIVRRVLGLGVLENELELMSPGTLVGILRRKLLRTPRAREMPHKTRHHIRYRHNRRSIRHCRELQTGYVAFRFSFPFLIT